MSANNDACAEFLTSARSSSQKAAPVRRLRAFFGRLPVLLICPGLALAIGLAIPSAYEFGLPSPARHDHDGLEQAAAGALMVTLIACCLAWWRHTPADDQTAAASPRKLQFGLRRAFIVLTLAALGLAVIPQLRAPQIGRLNVVMTIAVTIWSFTAGRQAALRLAAILGSMFLPFAWVFAYGRPFGQIIGLIGAIHFGPGLLTTALTAQVIDNLTRDHMERVAAMSVTLQLLLAGWLARRGGRLSVAYMFLILVSSAVSSFGFHALFRA